MTVFRWQGRAEKRRILDKLLLDHLREHPDSTYLEILDRSGLPAGKIYSSLGRLTEGGRVTKTVGSHAALGPVYSRRAYYSATD